MFELLLSKEFWIGTLYLVSCAVCGCIGYKLSDSNFTQYKYEQAQKYTEELNRQNKANKLAKEKEKTLLANLDKLNKDLEQKTKELSIEAKNEPNASKPSLPKSSVMRINKIR